MVSFCDYLVESSKERIRSAVPCTNVCSIFPNNNCVLPWLVYKSMGQPLITMNSDARGSIVNYHARNYLEPNDLPSCQTILTKRWNKSIWWCCIYGRPINRPLFVFYSHSNTKLGQYIGLHIRLIIIVSLKCSICDSWFVIIHSDWCVWWGDSPDTCDWRSRCDRDKRCIWRLSSLSSG